MKDFLRYLYYYLFKTVIMQQINNFERKKANKKYEKIENLHGCHEGERCFIVATGPSLSIDDLNLLKSEFCFSVNTIYRVFKDTEWRPDIYGTQDREIFQKIKNDIVYYRKELGDIFIGDCVGKFDIPAFYYHIDMQKHLIGNNETKFSDNINRVVYDGFSVTYSMIQVAAYMGFKEIYLLGCDTNYNGPKSHFDGNEDELPKGIDKFYDNAIVAYSAAKEFAEEKGISIVNCTRGGMLEVFQRQSLEEVLSAKERKT